MKRKLKKIISYILMGAMAASLWANLAPVPTKADGETEENPSVEKLTIADIDDNNKDEQGVIYTLNESEKTAKVSGQEILDGGEIRIPDKVQKGDVQYEVTAVGNYAFKDCLLITSLIVSDTVTDFYFGALDGSSCESLYLGAGVTTLSCVNYAMTSLKKIQVSPENCYYIAENGIMYDKEKTTLLKCPAKLSVSGKLTLPDSVKIIGTYAFSYGGQQFVDLSQIVEIEREGFYHASLVEADLRKCRKIGHHAFDFCKPQYIGLRENLQLATQCFYTGINAKGLYI